MPFSSLPATDALASDRQEIDRHTELPGHESFVAVVERHSPMVLGVCRRMLGQDDAEDAAQAVFLLFWEKAMSIRGESRIAAWLHRTAQHVCRNAKRSKATRNRREREAAATSLKTTPGLPEQGLWNEIREVLDEEVDRLPEKWRIAFVLFHCENHSLADVASLAAAPVSTVETWLRRARERLADRLRRRKIAVGAATLGTVLTQQLVSEAVPRQFVADTSMTVLQSAKVGAAACAPSVASLVKMGAVTSGWKSVWIASSLIVLSVCFPVVVIWLLPALQTWQSPDYPLLQGVWREFATETDGAPVNAIPPIPYVATLRVTGRSFERLQTLADGRVLPAGKGVFVLDSSRHPPAIDFRQWEGTAYGVYELDGDTLTICVTRNGGPRPHDLATRKHDDRILARYKNLR